MSKHSFLEENILDFSKCVNLYTIYFKIQCWNLIFLLTQNTWNVSFIGNSECPLSELWWKLISQLMFLVALTRKKKHHIVLLNRLLRCFYYFCMDIFAWNLRCIQEQRSKQGMQGKKKSSRKTSSDIGNQNEVESIKQGMWYNSGKARLKRCKGWLEQPVIGDKEHLANQFGISVRKPLLVFASALSAFWKLLHF